jgi:hypothetical protein
MMGAKASGRRDSMRNGRKGKDDRLEREVKVGTSDVVQEADLGSLLWPSIASISWLERDVCS